MKGDRIMSKKKNARKNEVAENVAVAEQGVAETTVAEVKPIDFEEIFNRLYTKKVYRRQQLPSIQGSKVVDALDQRATYFLITETIDMLSKNGKVNSFSRADVWGMLRTRYAELSALCDEKRSHAAQPDHPRAAFVNCLNKFSCPQINHHGAYAGSDEKQKHGWASVNILMQTVGKVMKDTPLVLAPDFPAYKDIAPEGDIRVDRDLLLALFKWVLRDPSAENSTTEIVALLVSRKQ